jgi:hypothetical protein
MSRHFHAAPWPTSLKAVSLLGTIILGAVSYAAYRAIPAPGGFTHDFGLGVALIPLAALVGAAFFVVRGYTVEPRRLLVERLVSSTAIPLSGLRRAWVDPSVCKGSVRVFGNGGLFSFSGWFYNNRLGRYRLFATDFRSAVVLQFPNRIVVVSPSAPHAFVEHLRHLTPGLLVGPEESSA